MTAKTEPNQISRYKKIISISNDLASTLDLDILLKRIVRAAAELTYSESASILLYDEKTSRLYFQVMAQFDDPLLFHTVYWIFHTQILSHTTQQIVVRARHPSLPRPRSV